MPKRLRLLSVTSMQNRPPTDLPVQQLITPQMLKWRVYRFYYEVFFQGSKDAHGSVLLGAWQSRSIRWMRGAFVCRSCQVTESVGSNLRQQEACLSKGA